MQLFYIRNLVSHDVGVIDPTAIPIPNTQLNKEEFKRLQNTPTFNHIFISAYEGLNPKLRVTTGNKAVKLHAFIIDYDANISDYMINDCMGRVKGEHLPSWICRTRGGGVRVIFEFEHPIVCQSDNVMKKFYKIVKNKLKLTKLFPGLDEAWTRSYEYWDIGIKWIKLTEYRIPVSILNYWLYEASNMVDWDYGECFIPLSEIKKEIDRRFPGRWTGEFFEGARGVRFWDKKADNPTAAVVRRNGIQCFTGDTPFLSWSAIFGEEFVSKYKDQRIGKIITDIYYDGDLYWRKNEDNWVSYDKSDMKLYLKVQHNVKTTAEEDSVASEMETVLNYIHENKRINYAIPMPAFKPGIININGETYLNTYNGKALPPDEDAPKSWGEGFPFLSTFLEHLFVKGDQLETFLAWLKVFYSSVLNYTPTPGQILVVAGGVGVGKTFLATKIVADLVGGCADGTSFLLGDTPFSATPLSKPLILVDDAEPAETPQKYQKYSVMLKKLVANRTIIYNQKFQKACPIIWMGRIMVLCNTDVVSLGILPSLELSSQDKLIFLRAAEKYTDFALPSENELVRVVNEELPKFAAYLLKMEVSKRIFDENSRYKVKSIHDDEMKNAAIHNSPASYFFEMLVIWRKQINALYPDKLEWSGNSTELYTSMNEIESLKPLLTKVSPNQIGRWLGILASRGFSCELIRKSDKRIWHIWWTPEGFPQEISQDNEDINISLPKTNKKVSDRADLF